MTQTIQQMAAYEGQLFPVHVPDRIESAQNAAVANGGSLTCWTPIIGTYKRIIGVCLSGSIAGRYQLGGAATIQFELRLVANQVLELYFGPLGIVMPDISSALYFYNQSGAASAMTVSAWGWDH